MKSKENGDTEYFKHVGKQVDQNINLVEKYGASGVSRYKERVLSVYSSHDVHKTRDFLCEAKVAIAFLKHGFDVTLRDKPDLEVKYNGEKLYVEVTRFREKEKDRDDFERMTDPNDKYLVKIDNIVEGDMLIWEQVSNVVIKKARKCLVDDYPNIVAIVSDSNTLGGRMLSTIIKHLEEENCAMKKTVLSKLNGVMIFDKWISNEGSVYYQDTMGDPRVPISDQMTLAIIEIKQG